VSGVEAEQNRATHSIWLVGLDRTDEPQPLTALDGLALTPRWSPDGSQLAFLAEDDGAQQLHLLTLAGGEIRTLTSRKEAVDDCTWSPDGRYIAYISRVPDLAYAEKDPDRREPRRITTLSYRLSARV
jgi:Tol biopolymer transport system component